MPIEGWLQILATLFAIFALSIPVGRYMARVVTDQTTWFDPLFNPIDNALYLLIGRRVSARAMDWRAYTIHMLVTNLVMAVIIYLVLSFQHLLPLNPLNFPDVDAFLAFNTAISFISNTNWQAYGGETTLSLFSQMGAITFPMFTSATTGFVVAMAFIRAFTVRDGGANLGNFYRDLVRFLTRVLLPICFLVALFMIHQGAVQTLSGSVAAHTPQGPEQTLVLGPVASQGTIELIGTNGGGFYNANAAHPFQNPTPITNIVLIVLMALLPASIVVTFGEMIGNRRQAWVLYGVMGALLVLFMPLALLPEQAGTPTLESAGINMRAGVDQPGGNMEGKEVRFGVSGSALFSAITTSFTTGAVNSALDSYTPLAGVTTLGQMMLQCVFGGKGVGFLNSLIYGLIAVF
ncbi:MAG TPA: potassium-transporting ATPase subunit KdpA, partial [Methylocystis sp.]|nr:potassium-transporting ATPase subunit KdpA [Methylocystis sp.]